LSLEAYSITVIYKRNVVFLVHNNFYYYNIILYVYSSKYYFIKFIITLYKCRNRDLYKKCTDDAAGCNYAAISIYDTPHTNVYYKV